MHRYIAFLRAINVGGRTVKMEALRARFEALGFQSVETFIASGNVIFQTASKDPKALEQSIERHLLETLGHEVKTFLRTEAELAAIARYQPFEAARIKAAGAFNVAFLSGPLGPEATAALPALKTDIDDFHSHGREVYWLCAKRQSDSTFSNAVFEKRLKVRATFRGWNTVAKLAAKYAAAPRDQA